MVTTYSAEDAKMLVKSAMPCLSVVAVSSTDGDCFRPYNLKYDLYAKCHFVTQAAHITAFVVSWYGGQQAPGEMDNRPAVTS